MSTSADTSSTSAERLIGRVKWFNNKAGYGFITVTDGARSGSDIFVHHSNIEVSNQQYKYLIQGEYVSFDLVRSTTGTHEWQAEHVSGINGGKLMCETRHEYKTARSVYKAVPTQEEGHDQKNDQKQERPRPQRPRQASRPAPQQEGEWSLKSETRKPRGRPAYAKTDTH